jgi:RNA polymerase sigma-70 factor (ECF subfamily)
MSASDAELVSSNDFGALYARHVEAVHGWFAGRIAWAAADLTAETFARAWLARRSFRDERDGSALPWLLGIGRNVLRESARRDRIEAAARERLGLPLELADDDFAAVEERLSPRPSLRAALEALPEHERRAVAAGVRRRRRRRVVGVVAAVAAVLVGVNLIPSGEDRPGAVAPASAVERAAQALEPRRGTILHFHMVGRQFEDGRPDVRWEHETWMHVGTGAIRTVQKPPVGPVAETAVGDHVESLWDAERERVVERSSEQPEAVLTEDAFRGEALELLRSGRPEVTKDRDTLRIAEGNRAYIVDGDDYTPIALRTRGTSGGTVLRFKVYESLPLNAETEKLLSIAAQHPGAPVVRDDAAFLALQRKLFATG